ncbi:hypothetical protein KCP75_23240 [Salmonella enterica subsp. enterica]|nr:hypothetical protein KCP75_23240 [Salmonella enterica subsp. enterica]
MAVDKNNNTAASLALAALSWAMSSPIQRGDKLSQHPDYFAGAALRW